MKKEQSPGSAKSSIDRINTIFLRLKRVLKKRFDVQNIKLMIDLSGDYPESRDYAQADDDTVYVSPKMFYLDQDRIEGILMHEIGHVVLYQRGENDHTELDADVMAEYLFNQDIRYDIDGVQTIDREHGIYRKRPDWLHK